MNGQAMTPCVDVQGRLSDFLDGHLPEPERQSVSDHLASCPDCRLMAEELRGLSGALRAMPALDPPSGLRERIRRRAIAAGVVGPGRFWRRFSETRWAVAAILTLFAAGIGLMLLRMPARPAPVEKPSIAKLLADLQQAQRVYRSSLQGMEKLAQDRVDRFPAGTRRTFEQNLALIDRTIADSEQQLQLHGKSAKMWEQLLAMYQKKVEFLSLFIEFGTT